MNKLVTYFLKPYDRTIETVVKADDKEHIYDEVAEYVVTYDIANKIANFFEAYKDTGSTNGVWISGFFGSGKSHLLKILSYVLENKEYNGESLGELFADKIKDDPKLKADIKVSIAKYKSESILFNIDQQAQITSKSDQNALLQVFYKVFYDHQGFYGFQPHIAEFESYLAQEEKYEAFKVEFEKNFGKSWIDARIDYVDPLIGDAVANSLGTIYGVDADKYEDYLDLWEDKHRSSIEDFADRVAKYIESKGKNFRLNFFVDEVGQYIAENTKLMLNLQTIAESLDTRCKGNSWVFVTSQEDLESLVGDDRQIQKDDYSKIQGRFNNRIALTSSNVDEVIERRLLDKNEEGKVVFGTLYDKEHANLRTLLTFGETGMQFKMYKDQTDFINKYPFVSYQFDLFQQCIKSLSRHNAFQGKHQSVGERSMLGVFQEVLKGLNHFESGDLVSFDAMFQGISGTLRTETQAAILLANNQLEHRNPLAVRVLKVLFLVKYFESFKATTHNIQVLLTSKVGININDYKKDIEQALTLLEEETYIQRSGEVYEYLTNEEKDIEEEIKDVRIDDNEMSVYLSRVLFDGIIKDPKIKYAPNKQEFEFTRCVDGLDFGRQHELKVAFATSDYAEYNNESHFFAKTMGDQTMMFIRLPEDKRFMTEVRMFLKTEKYCKVKSSSMKSPSMGRILREKGGLNSQRNATIQKIAEDLLANAKFYINGEENTRSSSSDGRTRVVESFQDLIKVVYTKLDMLGANALNEEELRKILTQNGQLSFLGEDEAISPPEQEVLNFVNRRKNMSERTTLTDIREHFNGRPFGWKMISTFCIVALLFKKGKIEAKQSVNILEDAQFAAALNNNQQWNNTLILPQQEIDGSLLRGIKDLHKELFDHTNVATEAKEIAKIFKEQTIELKQELLNFLYQTDTYPFLKELKPFKEQVVRLEQMDYAQLLTSFKEVEDQLLDFKEDHLDAIRAFMNGDQLKIYKDIREFVSHQGSGNLQYVDCQIEMNTLNAVCASKTPYRGAEIREGKLAMDRVTKEIGDRQEKERQQTVSKLNEAIANLKKEKDFEKINGKQQDFVLEPFQQKLRSAKSERFIANLINTCTEVPRLYNEQLNACVRLAIPPVPVTNPSAGVATANEGKVVYEAKPRYIQLTAALTKVKSPVTRIETKEQLDQYLESLKQTLMNELKENRKINLN